MHTENIRSWQHAHNFGQERKREGERRTSIVIAITSSMMIIEIIAGLIFGSMALLADGLHMASHATALVINFYAYIYARRHAHDARFCFGTGKVNALGGFTGAVLLAVFALLMAWGSFDRIIHPVAIAFNQAIIVAVIGLAVNGASVFILGDAGGHEENEHHENHGHAHHDHNLKSAYYHVLADALTSILAIIGLFAAKYFSLMWMDPVMGIVGAVLVCRWSLGLLRATSAVLLDKQGPEDISSRIRESIERVDDNRVADLHLWVIGPNIYGLILSVVSYDPKLPEFYKKLLPPDLGLAHVTVETQRCTSESATK